MRFTNVSTVDYIDHMGSDLTVVNAARVSFSKESEWEPLEDAVEGNITWHLSEADAKLINYLAKHNHWTPFGHCQAQIRVKTPIFVARQLVKHQIGLVWNEVSRRYVNDEPEYYWPDEWRSKPVNAKQGSGDETIDLDTICPDEDFKLNLMSSLETIHQSYIQMIDAGVAPEQARMILPQNMMTEWYWTGSLAAWARVANLRLDLHAQQETRDAAVQIADIMKDLFPVSWNALVKHTT